MTTCYGQLIAPNVKDSIVDAYWRLIPGVKRKNHEQHFLLRERENLFERDRHRQRVLAQVLKDTKWEKSPLNENEMLLMLGNNLAEFTGLMDDPRSSPEIKTALRSFFKRFASISTPSSAQKLLDWALPRFISSAEITAKQGYGIFPIERSQLLFFDIATELDFKHNDGKLSPALMSFFEANKSIWHHITRENLSAPPFDSFDGFYSDYNLESRRALWRLFPE